MKYIKQRLVIQTSATFVLCTCVVVLVVVFYSTLMSNVQDHEIGARSEQITKKRINNLRFDWTNLEPLSDLAKNISHHQSKLCNLPIWNYEHLPAGLGSNLHVWSQALFVAMENNARIRTLLPWLQVDEQKCFLSESEQNNHQPSIESMDDFDTPTGFPGLHQLT